MPPTISAVSETVSLSAPDIIRGRARRSRVLLGLWTFLAITAAAALGDGATAGSVEPDLARLLRYMTLLKGVFAFAALGICYWRLARPATVWREMAYVGGPGLMAGGALCLWQIQSAGLAVIGLHAGMFALLAAALTDPDFIPGLRRRSAGKPLPYRNRAIE